MKSENVLKKCLTRKHLLMIEKYKDIRKIRNKYPDKLKYINDDEVFEFDKNIRFKKQFNET